MNVITPAYTSESQWWATLAAGVAGRPPIQELDPAWRRPKLEAQIAGCRAAASAAMKKRRAASERYIARLIRESHL